MGLPARKLITLMIEHDPASPEFRRGVRESLGPQLAPSPAVPVHDLDLWHDVFVHRPLPWGRFLQSALLHGTAFVLIWAATLAWLRQQRILVAMPFDRSSVISYAPEEYLPPLDSGTAAAPQPQQQAPDPAFAKQPILSVPPEADNRSQTIVVPPDIKLDHDVPLPNIVATGAVVPVVPLDATRSLSSRTIAPDTQIIAPAPNADFTRERTNQALRSDIIAPPPEVTREQVRGVAAPEAAVVEPPAELTAPAKSRVGVMNIGPSQVVAPAPQLTVAEQHTVARGGGAKDGIAGAMQPVAPPPSVAGGNGGQGRLIALGIHPVTATGPVPVPSGNRRGTFAANPQGKPGGTGTPDLKGSKAGSNGAGGTAIGTGSNGHGKSSLPAGLHVGAGSGATGPIERNGHSDGNGVGDGDAREVASLSSRDNPHDAAAAKSNQRAASAVSDDKITEEDRQVFGDRRLYAMTLNMPNLNSSTGSWVIRFAELNPQKTESALLAPVPTQKTDPGYPLELMRTNVHGKVTLYAVIHSDGHVADIRVLSGPDDRLNAYAANALARWKFLPAERGGKPVAIEAVVVIPFRVRNAAF